MYDKIDNRVATYMMTSAEKPGWWGSGSKCIYWESGDRRFFLLTTVIRKTDGTMILEGGYPCINTIKL